MKKLVILLFSLFIIAGCQKQESMPKLHSMNIELEYGEELDLSYESLLNLKGFSKEQIKELEKNGEIDDSGLEYDEDKNIVPGKYIILISYYNDVVESVVIVTDSNDQSPKFEKLDKEIEIEVGNREFDFKQVIKAKSPIDEELTYTFDTSMINFDVVDKYPLVVTVEDSLGNKTEKVFDVSVVKGDKVEEEPKVEENTKPTTETTNTTKPQTNTNTTPSTTQKPSTTTPSTQKPTNTTPSTPTTPKPSTPTTPTNPTPSKPTTPTNPTPTTPVTPTPVQPTTPVEPEQPSTPVTPEQPVVTPTPGDGDVETPVLPIED